MMRWRSGHRSTTALQSRSSAGVQSESQRASADLFASFVEPSVNLPHGANEERRLGDWRKGGYVVVQSSTIQGQQRRYTPARRRAMETAELLRPLQCSGSTHRSMRAGPVSFRRKRASDCAQKAGALFLDLVKRDYESGSKSAGEGHGAAPSLRSCCGPSGERRVASRSGDHPFIVSIISAAALRMRCAA